MYSNGGAYNNRMKAYYPYNKGQISNIRKIHISSTIGKYDNKPRLKSLPPGLTSAETNVTFVPSVLTVTASTPFSIHHATRVVSFVCKSISAAKSAFDKTKSFFFEPFPSRTSFPLLKVKHFIAI